MFSEDHAVEDIVLAVINDGNGSMCGMTYQERCQCPHTNLWSFRRACRVYAEYAHKNFETAMASRKQILSAALLVQKYYKQHVKEIDKCNEDARIEASIKKDKESQDGR